MPNAFKVPQGNFKLLRYPMRTKETLQAWDAADEYLLNYIADQSLAFTRVLIINDSFGALSIACVESCINSHSHKKIKVSSLNDSYLSQQGLRNNFEFNSISITDYLEPINTLNGQYDLVLIKIQKSLAQLEDQLHRIRPHINEHTSIIAGGMVKMIHNSTLDLFQKIIGNTTSSLAKKKARLIFCNFDASLSIPENPYPSSYPLPNSEHQLLTHAGVFAQNSLDIGARFLIENLPDDKQYENIIDLACGNGVLGIAAALKNVKANLYFCDESYNALASAKENFDRILPNSRKAEFVVDDCLSKYSNSQADFILNNPPFHQQNTIEYQLAGSMFKQSFEALQSGGELWVVGNRHLSYHQKLKRIFGNCETVNANKKFVILKATKLK
jgi:16S rRNA (guanine1207-N2)-methyltransferase